MRNVFSSSSAIASAMHRWSIAFDLFSEMQWYRVVGNELTYSALISACEKGREWKLAGTLMSLSSQRDNHNQCTPQGISKSWSMGRCIPPAQFDAASSGSSECIQHQCCYRQQLWWLLGATAVHVESTEVYSSHRWDQLQFCHDEHLWGSTAVEGSSGAFEFYGAAQGSTWWGAQEEEKDDDDGNDGNALVSTFENFETGPLSNQTREILDCPLKITSPCRDEAHKTWSPHHFCEYSLPLTLLTNAWAVAHHVLVMSVYGQFNDV